MKKFSKTYAEKLVPLDEEEIKNRLQRVRDYRDRAEERRQGYEEGGEENNEQIIEQGEHVPIKLNGLDFDFMNKAEGDQQSKKQLELQKLRQFKESGVLLSLGVQKRATPQSQKLVNTMCSRILNALKQENVQMVIRNSVTFYEYDMDPLFPKSQPQIVTKKNDVVEKEQEMIFPQINDKILYNLSETLELTNGLTIKRTHQQRPKFMDKVDEEPDNIFDDAAPDDQAQEKEDYSLLANEFDPKEYLQEMKDDDDMLKVENNQMIQKAMEEAEKARQQKLKKHLNMLEGQEDFYQECFLPTNLTIEEDRKLKQEMEEYEQNLPLDQQKKIQKIKKKQKKKENYTQQLEQIDRIIKKTKTK